MQWRPTWAREELAPLNEKALKTGAGKIYIEDVKREFVEDYIFPTLKAGAVYEGKYLLGTSMARPLIAKKLEIARKEGAEAVAHGAAGKGNDQVRFELAVKALAPDLKIVAPWREWEIRSREDAIDYATARGIPVPVSKDRPYSMDRNLWHLSHEGAELEDPWNEPSPDVLLLICPPEQAPDKPAYVELEFEQGIPVKVDGAALDPVALIEKLNEIAGANGVGIVDMVENRLVGMKSRGIYETPGGTVLFLAHRELELLTDRATLHFKEMVAARYAELVYDGMWFAPLGKPWTLLWTAPRGSGHCEDEALRQLHPGRRQIALPSTIRNSPPSAGKRCTTAGRRRIHQPFRPALEGAGADGEKAGLR